MNAPAPAAAEATTSLDQTREESMTTLSNAGVGCDLRVRALYGPEALCHRLREMGFCEMAQVKKLSDCGNLVCSVCGTRLALSKDVAAGIIVDRV